MICLPFSRELYCAIRNSISTHFFSFWHKGGDWIDGDDLKVTLTDESGQKHTLTAKSLTDYQGGYKLVFDLGGCYTVGPYDSSLAGKTVNIRLTSTDSVLYAWEGTLS